MSKIQKVQRNWDYEKYNIKKEKKQNLEELLWVATNTPSKQYEGYYDLYYTDDRKVIEEIYKYTWGNTHRRNPPSTWRNSQANASVYIMFLYFPIYIVLFSVVFCMYITIIIIM